MNKNLRKEIAVPLIIIAAIIIAILAGVTTYRIVEDKDKYSCDCRIDFDAGTKYNDENEPLLDDEYIKDNDGYYYLLYEDGQVSLAPSAYDKDNHEVYKDQIKVIELSDNIEISSYNSKFTVKDNELKQVITIKDLTKDEFVDILEEGSPYAYIWHKDNKIDKILFFGETIIH